MKHLLSNRRVWCVCWWISCAVVVGAEVAPVAKKTAPQSRIELFVGRGTAGWLPQSNILPSAADIDGKAQKLGARQRNQGPFGLRMFPVEEVATPTVGAVSRAADRITLNQAIKTLRVNGINLEKKEFLLGSRNVFQGDSLEMAFQGEVFLAEVVEVGATQIVFRDNARQETGVLAHNLIQHLVLEPLQNRPRDAGLQGRLSPMEPIKNQRP